MKRYTLLPLLALTIAANAQDSYTNERITNSSTDVIGTARYVGMGGALGALGADMSVISWNPAGIGLYRKYDVALTFGGTWGTSSISEENRGKATFDQAGFVISRNTNNPIAPYLNFAFNYQKKLNFNHNYYADNPDLGGLSQMDQLAELTDWDQGDQGDQPNLAGLALDNDYFETATLADGTEYRKNLISSSKNEYTLHSEGSLQSFDFNMSTNIRDRAFIGLTLGIDNMRYRGWTYYREYDLLERTNYDLNSDFRISGTGINVKLGTIIRPIADNPFRFAFVIETPTWYRLTNTTEFDLRSGPDYGSARSEVMESKLKFNVRSPWRVRTGIGSTVGSTLAWDIDYELAAYAGMSQGYPETEYADGSTSGNMKDVAMNQFTRDNLRATHTLRAGIEVNATKNLAFRLGYNLSTSAYKKDITFDQYNLNSAAMYYSASTSYMRPGHTNILTLGMGYHSKSFYIDLAYKIRNQKADFYAFDTGFTADGTQFAIDNGEFADMTLDPVNVNLTRQAVTCTLGFKF